MSILTPFFNLFKLAKTNEYDIQQFNDNMDIIDTELHRPPLTVNNTEPNPTTRDIQITTVPLADNLTSDEAQINTGTYIDRTSGGEASIADGSAWLTSLQGNQVKTGYVAESIQMTVTLADPTAEGPISASLDRDTFVEEVTSSQTITLTYSNAWDSDPATYGITVTGTPVAGDKIQVVYVKENRGTITVATPTSFVSTGWNLYNHAAGYAKVVKYSNEYGFMIEGTYTALKFSETLSGEQTDITPVDGYFTVPSDGYVFVTGGNSTDTAIWMTWSDWTEEANGGVFAAYSQTGIDLSGVMVDFPNGLMKIGNYYDEINLNTQMAYSRVQRLEYTDENLAGVIASGVPYDTDANYIYAVRVSPVSYSISLDGEYTASDHGMEMFIGTSVPVTASSLYGNDLKGKLRRDVLTISQQTLTSGQKAQVKSNLGFANQSDLDTANSYMSSNQKNLALQAWEGKAPRSMSTGDFIYWNNVLYRAKQSISGGTVLTSSMLESVQMTTASSLPGALNVIDAKLDNLISSANFGSYSTRTDIANAIINSMSNGEIKIGRIGLTGATEYMFLALRRTDNVASVILLGSNPIRLMIKSSGTWTEYSLTGT